MPQLPTATEFFVVVPFKKTPLEIPDGTAQVYVVETTDRDLAAKTILDMGHERCIVLEGDFYEKL